MKWVLVDDWTGGAGTFSVASQRLSAGRLWVSVHSGSAGRLCCLREMPSCGQPFAFPLSSSSSINYQLPSPSISRPIAHRTIERPVLPLRRCNSMVFGQFGHFQEWSGGGGKEESRKRRAQRLLQVSASSATTVDTSRYSSYRRRRAIHLVSRIPSQVWPT